MGKRKALHNASFTMPRRALRALLADLEADSDEEDDVQTERVADVVTPWGPLVQELSMVLQKGGTCKVPFVHPAALLYLGWGEHRVL